MKKFKAKTPGQRRLLLPSNAEISDKCKGAEKSLLLPKRRTSGRNHSGHITCRHKGGAHKRQYRIVDFKRDKEEIKAKVVSIEYDPNRSSFIALLHYVDGEKRYILAPQNLKRGDVVCTSKEPPYDVGVCMCLKHMPIGSVIHNIELHPGKGGKIVRSAGLSAQLVAKGEGYATVKLPSGEVRLIKEDCKATFGVLSNAENNLRVEGKAGRKRWFGIRPTVRGIAMNPIDHPHGGGEGRGKGNHPTSPWGMPTKGYRTRNKKKSNRWIVKGRDR